MRLNPYIERKECFKVFFSKIGPRSETHAIYPLLYFLWRYYGSNEGMRQ